MSGNHSFYSGLKDCWIIKLDSLGNILWAKCYGGSQEDVCWSIKELPDKGFVFAGYTLSNDSNISGNHGLMDFWVVRIDSIGNIEWQKCIGGTNYELATSVDLTDDNGIIISGITDSNNGGVSGNHGSDDYWIVKLDSIGTILWQKCLGGTSYEAATYIESVSNGEYIISGYTNSNNGDVSGNHGIDDFWVVKIDSVGNPLWQKCLGGSNYERPFSGVKTQDGRILIAGNTNSNNGDVTGNHGGYDFWVVKLAPDTTTFVIENNLSIQHLNISPDPTVSFCTIYASSFVNSTLVIYDLTGRALLQQAVNEKATVNVAQLKSGMYVVEVRDKDGRSVKGKFVKE